MKQSIKQIFGNLTIYLYFILFVSILGLFLTLEYHISYEKVDNLKDQKEILRSIEGLKQSDQELKLIQLNSKSTLLFQKIDKLHMLYKYAFIERYFLNNVNEYMHDLDMLRALIARFNNATQSYYNLTQDDPNRATLKTKIAAISHLINYKIDGMLSRNASYNEKKFKFIEIVVYIFFFLVLLATFYYRSVLKKIYKDIDFLQQMDKSKKDYYTLEADAISLRMNRKSIPSNDPERIDPITGINNYKGMINAYSMKKHLKDSNFTSVTVLEIDNFSRENHGVSQSLIETILKKVAYTISLYEHPIDIIARTDYNQFTVILSRQSKEQAFKDMELIRESIAELKFHIPNQGTLQVTLTGGFVIKPHNSSLEEAVKQAKEILRHAQSIGHNRIFQTRDLNK